VIGTHTLLEACRKYGKLKRYIQISTDEVYGENVSGKQHPFTEISLLKPTNPYAASKASSEMLVHSYIHSYNLPAIVIRSNNIYGPGQYPEKVVPKFILQLMAGKKLTIQGSGNQLRSFLYIEDAVDAVMCVMFQGAIGEIYNISSTCELSILSLAKNILELLKPDETLDDWLTYIEDRNFNDKRYWIESAPLAALGWKQMWNLERGLRETVKWYQEVNTHTYWVSDKKRALIWGARGWIGGQFKKVLISRGWSVVDARSRADDRRAVSSEIDKTRATHIVSLIGRTHGPGFTTIDYLEQKDKLLENMTDNLYGPLVLAGIAKERGLHMLYMGTGCIFEYENEHSGGFAEGDRPNFFGSSYSTVKGFTDRIMAEEFGDTVLNVRIRMPISSEDGPRNFISKIIAYTKICSIPNSMTVLDDILPRLEECMKMGLKGTLNAVNPGTIDHATILGWYRDLQNPDHTWEEISNDVLVSQCVKGARSNNKLDTTYISKLFPTLPTIQDSVYKILENNTFAGRTAKN
jgi:dTDP-glucose 4,6-dehydratase